jgi:hypothetical protein
MNNISSLPKFKLSNIYQPIVYLLFDADEIVYIGQSKVGLSRVHNHARSKCKLFTHYSYFGCDANGLDDLEHTLINKYRPKYNYKLLPDGNKNWSSIEGIRKKLKGKYEITNRLKNLIKKHQIIQDKFGRYSIEDFEIKICKLNLKNDYVKVN